ncbi:unnamed protein product [Leptidea sinapis]|uniref:Protein naked cuticle homolog n=1 Tax=Leptidea sinapis TaxID=189913 RepID=A0A5E4Q393_9NEOP|nr:unnamed protein product [Leptidea sinapis]
MTCYETLRASAPAADAPMAHHFVKWWRNKFRNGYKKFSIFLQDIAGIVSTIYESIGKSVTVPHYGSKTIQVRLTVIPENGPTRDQRDKRDAKRRKRREERKMAAPVECVENSEEEQERLSHDDGVSSKSSSTAEKPPPVRPPPVFRQRPHRHQRREHRERKYTKKRSGSLQRRELLEIIQANMEKNHLSFQASRKPNESTVNEKEFPTKYQKHRNRSHTVNEKSSNAFHRVKSDTTGNNYLDLASGVDSHLCRYDRYLHAVICSSARHAHTGYHHKVAPPPAPRAPHVLHPRSRSHELAPQQQPRVLQIIFL